MAHMMCKVELTRKSRRLAAETISKEVGLMVKVPKNRTIASRVDYSDYLNSAEIDRQRYRGMIDHLFLLSWA